MQSSLSFIGKIDSPTRPILNLEDEKALNNYLEVSKPDVIVNAAAYTAVDTAEAEQNTAWQINARVPEHLADYAKQNKKLLVHYSTDYVYPGTGDQPWQEDSTTAPVNHYGTSKLAGDQAIANSGCQYLIFRTSWVYSTEGHNFMKTMLKLATSKESLSIVADQIGSPTPARLIADITALAVHTFKQGNFKTGIYHLAAKGETSWHGFAQAIFVEAQKRGHNLKIDPKQVYPIATRDYPTPATRPLNSRMSVNKLEKALGIQMPNWQDQLKLTFR